MRISDWSSDVCSSDLVSAEDVPLPANDMIAEVEARDVLNRVGAAMARLSPKTREIFMAHRLDGLSYKEIGEKTGLSVKGVEWHMSKAIAHIARAVSRSAEHTSELQSLMRISYDVYFLK